METTGRSNGDGLLTRLADLTLSNGKTVSRFGAYLVIQCKFIDAVLPQLSAVQRRKVAHQFRQGVEDVMSYTDDVAMPAEYHAALLEQTNTLLKSLER